MRPRRGLRHHHLAGGAAARAAGDRCSAEGLIPLERSGRCVVEAAPGAGAEDGDGDSAALGTDADGVTLPVGVPEAVARPPAARGARAAATAAAGAGAG